MSKNELTNENIWEKNYPEAISWHAEMPICAAHKLLEETVSAFPKRSAFDFLGKKTNWKQIGNMVNKMAKGLQDIGVSKGTKVGLFLPNCPYFLIAFYAIAKTGATVVLFNPLYAEAELNHQIEDSETDIMVTLDLKKLFHKTEKMLQSTRLKKVIVCSFSDILPSTKSYFFRFFKKNDLAIIPDNDAFVPFSKLIQNKGDVQYVDINPKEDVLLLQYTGGTTGVPKGAMLTHYNIVSNAESAVLWFGVKKEGGTIPFGEGKMVGVIPFFHVFALTAVMNFSVRTGFEIIALPQFDIQETLALIDKHKPHIFPAVPAIYNAINHYKARSKYDLSSLKYCISGGAALPEDVKKNFEKNTGCIVVEGYGLSETSPVVCVNPIFGENKAGSIGLPFPGTIVEIIDQYDKRTPKRQGETGELCVRGPQVMKGYWNKEEETDHVLNGDRFHTGDIAYMDEDGYVFIVDRIKDIIITGGYNVYPRHIEEAIFLHPAVEECVVAGLPYKGRGEIVKAWIKLKDGETLTRSELKDFLKDKLSDIERPKQIEFRENPLPRTMVGKLSRKDLLEEESV